MTTFPTNEFCSNNPGNTDNTFNSPLGFIQTPSYPTLQKDLNCSLKYFSNDNKHIRVYAVNIDLETTAFGKEYFFI